MTTWERVCAEVPQIALTDRKNSYIISTPRYYAGAGVKSLLEQAREFFPHLDKKTLRLEFRFDDHAPHVIISSAYLDMLLVMSRTSRDAANQILFVADGSVPLEPSSEDAIGCSEAAQLARAEQLKRYKESKELTVGSGPGGQIYVKDLSCKTLTFEIGLNPTVAHLKLLLLQRKAAGSFSQQRLIFRGMQLEDNVTLRSAKVEVQSTLHLVLRLRGGKPVIYLFPPVPLPSIQVGLTLSPEWSFSALYPVVDISKSKNGESSVYWQVSAEPSGTLVDLKTQTSLSYLFWEAHSEPKSLTLQQNGSSTPTFDPSRPSLDASNGVALPFSAFLPYLDKTLSLLSLHTAARNDFITYWLPSFNRIHARNGHIAFRFLPQAEYEQAAQLEVDPKPDVVTYVFMLFKGVDEAEAEGWRKPDEVDWVSEVGIKVDEAANEGLFRVLEWGGMEVVG